MKKAILIVSFIGLFFTGCLEDNKKNSLELPPKDENKSSQMSKRTLDQKLENIIGSLEDDNNPDTNNSSKNETISQINQNDTPLVHVPKYEIEDEETFLQTTKIGASLYEKNCLSCHGMNGSVSAFGNSWSIQGWDIDKLEDALNGYKNSNYGRQMAGFMSIQMESISQNDIKELAKYISKL